MKATKSDVDTLYLETAAAYGKKPNDAEGRTWLAVLAEYFTQAEIAEALISHKSDNSRDYRGNIRGEQMPTPAGVKDRIEQKRQSTPKQRIFCGDLDCFGMWRDDHSGMRRVKRCQKCELLRDAQVHPATGETFAEHRMTAGYKKAKEELLAKLAIIGGLTYPPKAAL